MSFAPRTDRKRKLPPSLPEQTKKARTRTRPILQPAFSYSSLSLFRPETEAEKQRREQVTQERKDKEILDAIENLNAMTPLLIDWPRLDRIYRDIITDNDVNIIEQKIMTNVDEQPPKNKKNSIERFLIMDDLRSLIAKIAYLIDNLHRNRYINTDKEIIEQENTIIENIKRELILYEDRMIGNIKNLEEMIDTNHLDFTIRFIKHNIKILKNLRYTHNLWTYINTSNVRLKIQGYSDNFQSEMNELKEYFIFARKRIDPEENMDIINEDGFKNIGNVGIFLENHSYTKMLDEAAAKSIGGFYLYMKIINLTSIYNQHRQNVRRDNIGNIVQWRDNDVEIKSRDYRQDDTILKDLHLSFHLDHNYLDQSHIKVKTVRTLPDENKTHISDSIPALKSLLNNEYTCNIYFNKINNLITIINKNEICNSISYLYMSADGTHNQDNFMSFKNALFNFLKGCETYLNSIQSDPNYNPQLNLTKIPDNTTDNIYRTTRSYNKYLKYKTKYLELKSLFDKMSIS